jgi:hypothetical protein
LVSLASIICVLFAAPAERPPLPESLLTESATDVDAEEAGETTFEANLASMGARAGGARATFTSLEVEWRVLRQFGLRLEPSYAHIVDPGGDARHDRFGLAGALALSLFHDFPRDVHIQLELLGRTPESANERVFEPEETELPLAADLVTAVRRGIWTLRTTVGAEAGGSFAHAPLHTDMALLTPFQGDGQFGFFGIEVRADWARENPLVLAPEVVAITTPVGLPFSLSLALPVNVGASDTATSFGIFLRLMLMTGREAEYGRGDAKD